MVYKSWMIFIYFPRKVCDKIHIVQIINISFCNERTKPQKKFVQKRLCLIFCIKIAGIFNFARTLQNKNIRLLAFIYLCKKKISLLSAYA